MVPPSSHVHTCRKKLIGACGHKSIEHQREPHKGRTPRVRGCFDPSPCIQIQTKIMNESGLCSIFHLYICISVLPTRLCVHVIIHPIYFFFFFFNSYTSHIRNITLEIKKRGSWIPHPTIYSQLCCAEATLALGPEETNAMLCHVHGYMYNVKLAKRKWRGADYDHDPTLTVMPTRLFFI